MLFSILVFIASFKPSVPQIIWEKRGLGQIQISADGRSILSLTGATTDPFKFIRIDIDSGVATPEPNREYFDNLRVNNRFIDFHGQLMELLFSSTKSAIAINRDGLYRIGSDGHLVNWTTNGGLYSYKLHGDPDRGPFALELLEGEPHYDWFHQCTVVMPDLRILKTNYFECLDVGSEGILVRKIQGYTNGENIDLGSLTATYLDPKYGNERWRVKDVTKASFWNGYVVMQRNKLELRSIKTGRLQPLPASLKGSWSLERVVGNYLLLVKDNRGSPETIRCVKATKQPAPVLGFDKQASEPPKKVTRPPAPTVSAATQKTWSETGVPAMCAPGPKAGSVFLLFGKQWELRDMETGRSMPFTSAETPHFNGAIERTINANGEIGNLIWQSAHTSIAQLSGRRFVVQKGDSIKVFPVPPVITHGWNMNPGEIALGVTGNPDSGAFGLYGTVWSGAGQLENESPLVFLKTDGTQLGPSEVVDTDGAIRTLANERGFRENAGYFSGIQNLHWVGGLLYTIEIGRHPHGTAVLKNPATGVVLLNMPEIDARSDFVFASGPYLLLQWNRQLVCWRLNLPKGE